MNEQTLVERIHVGVIKDIMTGPTNARRANTVECTTMFTAGAPWSASSRRERLRGCTEAGVEAVHLVTGPAQAPTAEVIMVVNGKHVAISDLVIVEIDHPHHGLATRDGRSFYTLVDGRLRRASTRSDLDLEQAYERAAANVLALLYRNTKELTDDDFLLMNMIGGREGHEALPIGRRAAPRNDERAIIVSEALAAMLTAAAALLLRCTSGTSVKNSVLASGGQWFTGDVLNQLLKRSEFGEARAWLEFGDDIGYGPVGATIVLNERGGVRLLQGCGLWMADRGAPLIITHEDPKGRKSHYRLNDGRLIGRSGQPAHELSEGNLLARITCVNMAADALELRLPTITREYDASIRQPKTWH